MDSITDVSVCSLCFCPISYTPPGLWKWQIEPRSQHCNIHSILEPVQTCLERSKATLEKHKYFKGRKLNTFRNLFHPVNHERPLQAGDGSLGYGDGDHTLNSKKDEEHHLFFLSLSFFGCRLYIVQTLAFKDHRLGGSLCEWRSSRAAGEECNRLFLEMAFAPKNKTK